MGTSLRSLWASAGFRLACYVGLLVAMALTATLSIVYLQTVGVMQQRMVHALSFEAMQLESRFQDGGVQAVAQAVNDLMADGRSSDDELLLLTDATGTTRAGNLEALPERLFAGPYQRTVVRLGKPVFGRLLVRELPDGSLLVVGRDLRDQQAIETLVVQASLAAVVVATLILIGGTFVFRQVLDRSVGSIRATAARIAAGNLQERVALTGQEDEFDLLNRDINHMLDRIQSLMDGVRHMSDTIAHNLRTPLTRVLLRLRHVSRERAAPSPEALRNTIDAAAQDLEELAVTFEKLLQIAEAEAGTRRMPFHTVALGAVVADVCEMYDAVAEAQGSTLVCQQGDDATVLGDADLLAGVVVNLVDNALKYGGPGATVTVVVQRTEHDVVLTVQDNGPGIDPAEFARVGARFHRLHRTLPGHGLGLASVRAVVALHSGTLQLGDAAPGLRVQVTLPLAAAH